MILAFPIVDETVYHLVYLGHIVAILIAFAPAVIHPLLGARLEKRNDGSLRAFLVEASVLGRKVYGNALVASGLFGILLVLMSDDNYEFSDAWISIAFVLWFAMLGVVHGMLLPSERKWADGDDDAGNRVKLAGQIATVLLLLMLVDMIMKPGFP